MKPASGEEPTQEVQDSEETPKGRFRKWYLPCAALLVIGISLFLLDRWDNFFPATITPAEAVDHVGRTVRVKGTPSASYRRDGTVYLKYGPESPNHVFSVEVPPAFVQAVFGVDDVWSRRRRMHQITVTGEIQMKEGRVSIVLKDAKHLAYLERPEPEDVRGLAAVFHEDERVFRRELKRRGLLSTFDSLGGSDHIKKVLQEESYFNEAMVPPEMRDAAASWFSKEHSLFANDIDGRLRVMKRHVDSKLDLHQIGLKIMRSK